MGPYLKKCLSYLKAPYVAFRWLHFHPYTWLDDNVGPVLTKSRQVWIHWYLNMALYIGFYVFLLWRTVQVLLDPGSSLATKFQMVVAVLMHTCGVVQYVAVIVRRTADFVAFFRAYIKLLKDGTVTISWFHRFIQTGEFHPYFQMICIAKQRGWWDTAVYAEYACAKH